jgi:hypothetical protein
MNHAARRGRSTLVWALAAFAAVQAGLNVLADGWFPVLRDPELGRKHTLLRTRLAEGPARPLVLALGSSRLGVGFRPDQLPADADPFLVFNYAFVGAGPVRELACLRQLLREGVRPVCCVIEVHPAFLGFPEERWIRVEGLEWDDLREIVIHSGRAVTHLRSWGWSRLTPAYTHRYELLCQLAPDWLPGSQVTPMMVWRGLDASGWWRSCSRLHVTPAEYQHGLELTRCQYANCLAQFDYVPARAWALEEMLDLCRQENIAPVLVTMPETTAFRSWYSLAARAAIDGCMSRLSQEYAVPWVDARTWLADDGFEDGHHLLRPGADAFTQRFAREALVPVLRGLSRPGGQTLVAARADRAAANGKGRSDATPQP